MNDHKVTSGSRPSHAVIKHPKPNAGPYDRNRVPDTWSDFGWGDRIFKVVRHTGSRVWVRTPQSVQYRHPDVLRVTDGCPDEGDDDRGEIVSVPAAWCRFLSKKEAKQLALTWEIEDGVRANLPDINQRIGEYLYCVRHGYDLP